MNKRFYVYPHYVVIFLIMALVWNSITTVSKAESSQIRPILIEAPMKIESDVLVQRLKGVTIEKSGPFIFYIGKIDNYPVIVAKTGMGMENASAATAVAIEKYNPLAIINQGTSGGHDPDLHVFDIVLGNRVTNIGSFKTPKLEANQGIKPSQWEPIDLVGPEGGLEAIAEIIRYYNGDPSILTAAKAVKDNYKMGNVVEGTIGSSDVWNNEVDRIHWFHKKYGTSVEEMEAAGAAQMAQAYHIPFLGIRIVSNNELNNGNYNPKTTDANQEYVYKVVREYITMMIKNK